MPIYEYKCKACDHKFERIESIRAEPTRKCEKCGRNKAERIISGGLGLNFVGEGFHCTDYGKSKE